MSMVSFYCLNNSFFSGVARANGTELATISEVPTLASDPQPKIAGKSQSEAQAEAAKKALTQPETKKLNEVPIVLSDADLEKSGEKVKEVNKGADSLEGWKSISEVIKNGFEVIAIIVGGFWTYTLFVSQRQKYPRANLSHKITHRSLGNGKSLLNIDATLSNAGGVLIRIVSGELRIKYVSPLSTIVANQTTNLDSPFPKLGREFPWDASSHPLEWPSGPCEIEPGEENQFHYDCVLPEDTEVIKIYTYYKNEVKSGRDIGWNLTTVYDLTVDSCLKEKEGAMTPTAQTNPPRPAPRPSPGPEPLQEPRKPGPGG